MRRHETEKQLDNVVRGERSSVGIAILFVIVAGFVLAILGYFPGTDQGNRVASVRWSEQGQTWKSYEPHSKIRAVLDNGVEIYATSPHTPPPVPGERIVLHVRKNVLGWYSYTWLAGEKPALTDGARGR